MTGGYKIIDLYGLDLANMQLDSNKIEKIFSDIESTYKTKALLFDNYKINGIEQNATFSSAVVKNSGFEITLGDYKILIKNDSVEDTSIHLYRHDIKLIIDNSGKYGQVRFSLYNTSNIQLNTKELLIENGELDIGVAGYVQEDSGVSIIYQLDLSEDNNYIYYNDSEEDFTITNIDDTTTKIF